VQKGFKKNSEAWNWRTLKSVGTLGAMGLIMLFQYQNCAPASGARSMNAYSSNDNGVVTTIDDVNAATGVAFLQSKVQVASSDQPTVIEGECAAIQEGAVLGWKVHDDMGHMRETGYSQCEQGHFQVEMAPSNELECDKSYEVSAQLAAGVGGHVELQRDCSDGSLASNSN
jgi:hypothetical protein